MLAQKPSLMRLSRIHLYLSSLLSPAVAPFRIPWYSTISSWRMFLLQLALLMGLLYLQEGLLPSLRGLKDTCSLGLKVGRPGYKTTLSLPTSLRCYSIVLAEYLERPILSIQTMRRIRSSVSRAKVPGVTAGRMTLRPFRRSSMRYHLRPF